MVGHVRFPRIVSGIVGLVSVSAVFIAGVVTSERAHAISFDKLETPQVAMASYPATQTASSTLPLDEALGGYRSLIVTSTAGTVVSSIIGSGFASHSQNANTKGTSLYIYDGDPAPGVQATGLGGINLRADGALALKLVVEGYDYPNSNPLYIKFFIYDASDPTGLVKASQGSLTLNKHIDSTTEFLIPFSSLTPVGSAVPADLTNVGAIVMMVDGSQSPDHDLTWGFVGTDGRCDHVPVNGVVVDKCGVCNGDNSTCSDCKGTPNGLELPGAYCPSGVPGICGDGTWAGTPPKNCECKPDKSPTTEICDGLDNDCDGQIDNGIGKGDSCTVGVGACGNTGVKICAPDGSVVCSVSPREPGIEICDGIDNNCDGLVDEGLGKGDTCSVGVGSCASTGVNVCALDGSVQCSTQPGTPSPEICDGLDNDCDGIIDDVPGAGEACTAGLGACGVAGVMTCGAEGALACASDIMAPAPSSEVCDGIDNDCNGLVDDGTPAKGPNTDACGICGGDGTSCLQCGSVDMSATLEALDGGAKEQQMIVRKATNRLRSLSRTKATARYISQVLAQAQKLQLRNWILSWQLPRISTTCEVNNVCVTSSNVSILTEYRQHNAELRQLALKVIKKIKAARRGRKLLKADKKLQTAATKQFQANDDLSKTVPEVQYNCADES